MNTQAILHAKDVSIAVPQSNMTELRERLYLAFAYEEILGETTYRHYDVWGVRRAQRKSRVNLGASATPAHQATVLE